ncbi:UNVERIFIED_CONTAM: hypothetical protein FKN15_008350 [Acipenser sinensis]
MADFRFHPTIESACPYEDVPRPYLALFQVGRLMQPPKSYSVGGQRSSRAATGKPAGARPDYRGRWCAVSRGHSDRPNPPSPRATLGQLCVAPWELPSSIGKGIAWIRTRDLQAIERNLHSRGAPLLDAPLRSPPMYVVSYDKLHRQCATGQQGEGTRKKK